LTGLCLLSEQLAQRLQHKKDRRAASICSIQRDSSNISIYENFNDVRRLIAVPVFVDR